MEQEMISTIAAITSMVAILFDRITDKKTLRKIANLLVFYTYLKVRFARAKLRSARYAEEYRFTAPIPVKKVVTYQFMNGVDMYPDGIYRLLAREIMIDCKNRDWATLVLDLSRCTPLTMPEKIHQVIKMIVDKFDSEKIILYEPTGGVKGTQRINYRNVTIVPYTNQEKKE